MHTHCYQPAAPDAPAKPAAPAKRAKPAAPAKPAKPALAAKALTVSARQRVTAVTTIADGDERAASADLLTLGKRRAKLTTIEQPRKKTSGKTSIRQHVCQVRHMRPSAACLPAPRALTLGTPPQDGKERNYQRTDCIQCNPKNFCLVDDHMTRERRPPRKSDCAGCRREAGKLPWPAHKNMCGHHKPDCANPALCLYGCIRKDCCVVCSGCEHGDLPRRCGQCLRTRDTTLTRGPIYTPDSEFSARLTEQEVLRLSANNSGRPRIFIALDKAMRANAHLALSLQHMAEEDSFAASCVEQRHVQECAGAGVAWPIDELPASAWEEHFPTLMW